MSDDQDHSDIPCTYVVDTQHSMPSYRLNRLITSVNKSENRNTFGAIEAGYLEKIALTSKQRDTLDDDAKDIYRHRPVRASNSAEGLLVLENV